jgi:hypothetical protein
MKTVNSEMLSVGDSIFASTSRSNFGRGGSSYFEEDINFCLRQSDTALSAISRSKILNEVTNNVMKAIIIGYDPIISYLSSAFEDYREQLDRAECVFDEGEVIEQVCTNLTARACADKIESSSDAFGWLCTQDLLISRIYLDRLEKLLLKGIVQDSILGGIYDRGYKRLLTILKDIGCIFPPNNRPKPIDQDICLSMMDKIQQKNMLNLKPTKTQVLNTLSNVVYRAVLYGRKFEKEIIVNDIESMIPAFVSNYTRGDIHSQEVLFMKTLIILLNQGLSSAENVILNQNKKYDDSNILSIRSDSLNGKLENISNIKEIMSDRLNDTYQNAFHRIVECCFTEIGRRASSIPENNEILINIANWEKNLRVDMTDGLWKRNPVELAGTWLLADVRGEGSLTSIAIEIRREYE